MARSELAFCTYLFDGIKDEVIRAEVSNRAYAEAKNFHEVAQNFTGDDWESKFRREVEVVNRYGARVIEETRRHSGTLSLQVSKEGIQLVQNTHDAPIPIEVTSVLEGGRVVDGVYLPDDFVGDALFDIRLVDRAQRDDATEIAVDEVSNQIPDSDRGAWRRTVSRHQNEYSATENEL